MLAGMPQYQNAILGNQVDYSQFQPTQLAQPNYDFMQTQIPQATNPFAIDPTVTGPQPQGGQSFVNQQIHPLSGNFNSGRRN